MKRIITTALFLVATMTMQGQVGSPVYKQLVDNKKNASVEWDGHGYLVEVPIFMGEDEDGEELWMQTFAYYDKNGKELFDPGVYTHIEYIPEGNIFVFEQGYPNWGISDNSGDYIINPDKYKYTSIQCVIVVNFDGSKKWIEQIKVKRGDFAGVLDSNYREILAPTKYTDAEYDYDRQLFIVELGEKGGVLDKNGKELIMFQHTGYISSSVDNKWFIFRQGDNKKQYLCTYKGQLLWTADGYELDLSEDLVAVKKGNLWGYLNVNDGKIVIPAQYTSAEPFQNGVAKVSKGKESFLISNPLTNGGKSTAVSSLAVNAKSDVDINIPETQRSQENTFVIIMANQDYPDFSVQFAQNDGLVFKEYCRKTLGIPKDNIMYYENATLNTIKGAITRIKDLADVYDGDAKVIFYYAGQGVSDTRGNPYILPSDGTAQMASSTGYALSQLYSEIGNLSTQSSIILLDASFNNTDREGKTIPGARGNAKAINPAINGKVVVVTASDSGESALSNQEKSHGNFTYYLCKKIRDSKGNVNFQELTDYVSSHISKSAVSQGGQKQHPQVKNTSGKTLQNIQL